MPVTRDPEPGVQEGHAPVTSGTSGKGMRTTVTTRIATARIAYWFKEFLSLSSTAGKNLEQLILFPQSRIDGCLHDAHSTLKLGHVKTAAEARGQQLVGDIKRGHNGDALD